MPKTVRNPTAHSLLLYFAIAFIFTWIFWLPGVMAARGVIGDSFPVMGWLIIGAHGPLVASLVLTYREKGSKGLKSFFLRGLNPRIRFSWWVLIIAVPILLASIASAINMATSEFIPDTTLLENPLLIIPTFAIMFFIGGSLQEEYGWRGYALPRMISLSNPFVATTLLGLIWGVWHLPLFFATGQGQSYMNFGLFIVLAVAFSYLFTWVYFKTRFSIFSALLLHAAINTSLEVFPPIEKTAAGNQRAFGYLVILYCLLALAVVLIDKKLWFRRGDHNQSIS